MTLTQAERVARARASSDGKVDPEDVLALVAALGAVERERDEALVSSGDTILKAAAESDAWRERVAMERARAEKAEADAVVMRGCIEARVGCVCAQMAEPDRPCTKCRALSITAGAALLDEVARLRKVLEAARVLAANDVFATDTGKHEVAPKHFHPLLRALADTEVAR